MSVEMVVLDAGWRPLKIVGGTLSERAEWHGKIPWYNTPWPWEPRVWEFPLVIPSCRSRQLELTR